MPLARTPIDANELTEFLEHIRPQYVGERIVSAQWNTVLHAGAATPEGYE